MRTTFILAAWLWAGQQTPPPDPALSILRGTVTDAKSQAPIKDALVALADLNTSVHTTADGRFEFTNVAPGAHTLTISTVGYIFVRRRVELTAGVITYLAIPLAEGTGTYQETVTVSGDVARDVGVATQSALGSAGLQALRGVATDDPMRAMQALPGAATGDDFQAQFSVRGSAFRHMGVVTDGVSTALLLHQVRGANDTGSIAMLNSDVIEGASLQSGARPLKDGDWLGATLAFDLREGSRDRAVVRGAVSGTSASTVVEGPLGHAKKGSVLFSLRKSYIDWLVRKFQPSIKSTLGFSDVENKWVYDANARQRVELLFLAGTAHYRELSTSTANGLHDALSRTGLFSFMWRYTRPSIVVTERVSALATRFANHGERGQELASGHTRTYFWRNDVVKPLAGAWTAEAGSLLTWDRNDQGRHAYQIAGPAIFVAAQQGFGARTKSQSAWGQITFRTASTGLVAGVRVSHDTGGPWTAASPWLTAERTIGKFTIRGGVSRAAQFPDLAVARLSAPGSVGPEHASSFDAGLEFRPSTSLRWSVTGFYRRDADIVRRVQEDQVAGGLFVRGATFPTFASALRGTTRGTDIVFERRAGKGPNGWVGYTFSHTRYHDRVSGEDFDGDFDQRHTLNAFVQQRLSYRLATSATLRSGSNFPLVGYFSGTPDVLALSDVRNRVRLPTYFRLDARVSRTFTSNTKRLTVFVEIMNVTNHRNLAPADGTIFGDLTARGFADRVIPRLPSIGILIEF